MSFIQYLTQNRKIELIALKKWSSCFILVFILSFCQGQSHGDSLKVGLVLGGGAVKGIAHVGVIKVLAQEGIIPDYITGTSIGAIVGGLYAMGYDTADLYHISRSTSWSYFFNDDWPRLSYSPHMRDDNEPYLLKLAIAGRSVSWPRSFVYGEKLSLLLSKFTIPAHNIRDFDELRIPFRCIATELETGHAKVFDSGDLTMALRASMSLPSIFEPVAIDGITYIDGGMVRNLPVQDVLEMGADFTIAVDVSAELYESHQVKTALDMLDQSISYRINESNQVQRSMADIIIKPDMTGINGFSFNLIDTLLKRGEEAALKAMPEIKARLHNRNTFSNSRKAIGPDEWFDIESLRIQGLDKNGQQVIKDIISLHQGQLYSIEWLEESLTQMYTQGWVRQLYYRLLKQENKKYTMEIDAVPAPSSWLKMGVNYDSDLKAGILLGAEKRHFLIHGSKLSGDFRVSENPLGQIDFDVNNLFFSKTGITFRARANFSPAFAYVQGRKVNEFKFHRFSLGSSLYTQLFKNGLLSAGIYWEQYTQNRQLFEPSKDEIQLTQTVVPISLDWDTYDRLHFPQKGFRFHIHSSWALNGSLERISEGLTFDFSKTNYLIRSYYNQVWPLSQNWALVGHLDWGNVNYEVNSNVYAFYLGRSLQGEQTHVAFTGLKYMGQVASHYGIGRIQLRWEMKKDIFMSLTGNYGYTEGVLRRQMTRQEVFGGGIEWGAITPIGPVRFSAEYGNFHPDVVTYLHIGHVF